MYANSEGEPANVREFTLMTPAAYFSVGRRLRGVMEEQQQLVTMVQQWFNHPEQVAHYTQEVPSGLTPIEQALLATLQPRDRVLDCGCGAGRVTLALAQRGCRVVGVDVSRALLQRANIVTATAVPVLGYLHVEPFQLPLREATFDSVVAIKVYCYLPARQARRHYLEELARLLRPGGTLRMLHYLVPAADLHFAYDETYKQIAPQYNMLEAGDTFNTGVAGIGYVHWFTEEALRAELHTASLALEYWEDDRAYGGDGTQAVVQLRKA